MRMLYPHRILCYQYIDKTAIKKRNSYVNKGLRFLVYTISTIIKSNKIG